MRAIWNSLRETYDINLTVDETATVVAALTVASFEMTDKNKIDAAKLLEDFLSEMKGIGSFDRKATTRPQTKTTTFDSPETN